ncbi:MAG: hypothetical protein HXX10_20470 [Rhodoplanes sp.]|uniref:hypothetical protein n=1 Tax=Rhodoplanes sp. TaxID=1968906 RepID=UPI0017DAA21D|nr:hypothetical protein [Rhodoplanes sp.]NVO16409.1 hypothetical protein [Rhodoplanes sp.]
MTLRRFSGVGIVLFALIFVVGSVRAHALAAAVGDSDLCSAIAFTGTSTPAPATGDPGDLASCQHACCELGFCLGATPIVPTAPSIGPALQAVISQVAAVDFFGLHDGTHCAGFRPRGPPNA